MLTLDSWVRTECWVITLARLLSRRRSNLKQTPLRYRLINKYILLDWNWKSSTHSRDTASRSGSDAPAVEGGSPSLLYPRDPAPARRVSIQQLLHHIIKWKHLYVHCLKVEAHSTVYLLLHANNKSNPDVQEHTLTVTCYIIILLKNVMWLRYFGMHYIQHWCRGRTRHKTLMFHQWACKQPRVAPLLTVEVLVCDCAVREELYFRVNHCHLVIVVCYSAILHCALHSWGAYDTDVAHVVITEACEYYCGCP